MVALIAYIVVASGLTGGAYLVGVKILGLRRSIGDLAEALRPIDLERVEAFLDAAENQMLRACWDAKVYRRVQWNRMRVYLKVVRRMDHNARVLVNFANQELKRFQEAGGQISFEQVVVMEQLQREAIRVRAYSLATILKIYVLLAIHPVQTPSLTWLRSTADFDGIRSYRILRNVSLRVFEEFGTPIDKRNWLAPWSCQVEDFGVWAI
jgi:hypothetical protein